MFDLTTLSPVAISNLKHVLENNCQDPDCEIHNPEVGVAKGTVSVHDVTMFLAGAFTMQDLISQQLDNANDAAVGELLDVLALNGKWDS